MTHAVRAEAPVRVADVGGWTDTWFGSPGRVCHLAVGPGVAVEARLVEVDRRVSPVLLNAPSLGESYRTGPHPDPAARWGAPVPGRHPLLEHAVAAVLEAVDLPEGRGIDVTITSAVPPGASLGTSASVVVAVVAALDALVGGGALAADGPASLAELAHRIETMRAGREAGVQDQWAAAFGGAGLLAVNPYPSVARTPVPLAPDVAAELDARLVTVVFAPHDSSTVHGHVITDMVTCSSTGHDRARAALRELSALAGDAADALGAGDLDRWGAVLTEATGAQQRLRAELVGGAHERAIALASESGATGWKVNGAGGEGGSLTILAADASSAARVRAELVAADPDWSVLDLRVAPAGVTVAPV
ncbi:MAG: hypothetical protein KF906_11605 [Actinobacteria bacterium]|nr:hypothetical protein [Actinomycetota bacterium]